MPKSAITEQMLLFFEHCAEGQEVSRSVLPRRIYIRDNRVEHIPRAAAAFFPEVGRRQLEEWFARFLAAKFLFLSLLLEGNDNTEALEATFGVGVREPRWQAIFEAWRHQLEEEKWAYLYRIAQLGDDVVHQEWYTCSPEFLKWSELCKKELGDLWEGFLHEGFDSSYSQLCDEQKEIKIPGNANEMLLERSHSKLVKGLELARSQVVSHLTRIDSPGDRIALLRQYFDYGAEAEKPSLDTSPATRVADKVTELFLDMVEHEVGEEDRYLVEFTKTVKEVFECAISDYLDVEQDGGAITIRATSLEISGTEMRSRLKESEYYDRGEGITGSILVPSRRLQEFCVGTNDLLRDARQSPWHYTAYKDLYKRDFHNFWVFPLYEGERIHGAFRVIDRLAGPCDPSEGYWPQYVRLQLSETARWFELFWQFVRTALLAATLPSRRSPAEHLSVARALAERFGLSWIREDFLAGIMQHLPTVVHRKVEHHRIGCCITVAEKVELEALESTLDRYTVVERGAIETLEHASQYYSIVFPTGGTFLFDANGGFRDVLELQYQAGLGGVDCIKKVTKDFEAIAFLVERNHQSIRIFVDGTLGAEYYLSDHTGGWLLRFYQKVLDDLNAINSESRQPISDRVIERVYEQAWHLSYLEIGSMIIVTDCASENGISSSVRFSKKGVKLRKALDNLSDTEFDDLAMMDGAVVVSPRGMVTNAGVLLHVEDPDPLPSELQTKIRLHAKGARHTTAAHVSRQIPSALVVVVSENRGISILYQNEVIAWNM